jgi:predicted nucleic acid-binding protein
VIHLNEAAALDLLAGFDRLIVPETVHEELRVVGVPAELGALDTERQSATVDEDDWPELDAGETEALALCRQHDGMFLTDDLDARHAATDAGIEVHGSIGVVLTAYADGRLAAGEATATVRALERESTLYLARPLVERAIARIEDERDG